MCPIFFQIVFESLPVSSSGHVRLFSYLMSYCTTIPVETMSQAVDFLLHGPALLLYAIFFFNRWRLVLCISYFKRHHRYVCQLFLFICCADLITGLGYLSKKALGASRFPNDLFWPVIVGFILTITVIVLLDRYEKTPIKKRVGKFSLRNAILLGFAQLGAFFLPGLSRLAITYATLRFCGFSRREGFELSILVQVPLIIAALVKGAIQAPWCDWFDASTRSIALVILTIALSSIVSYFCLRLTYNLALQGRLIYFAYYILGLVFSILLLMLACYCF